VKRRTLSQEEIANEVRIIVGQGHKRILMVAGEAAPPPRQANIGLSAQQESFRYILDAIATIYGVKAGQGEIRRVNVNLAPLSVEEFRSLKAAGIGTYQIFQETYHRGTYAAVHRGGRKRHYDWRVTAMDRAMEAGINDVGIGPLFGLYGWRCCSTSTTWRSASAAAVTPSACRASSPRWVPISPPVRLTR
jgi:2-iminoacetate synthase